MEISQKKYLILLFLFFISFHPLSGHSANKALLIGTTSYENPSYNLDGIDLDILQMTRVAQKLGFEKSNIKTLTGSEVVLSNIEDQFTGFLKKGVSPQDTLLIYYSGHGVQVPDTNGDEVDNEDEAISLYNLKSEYRVDLTTGEKSELTWGGVLLDDRFSELLSTLTSDNVIVIVDACHSGTVTRSYTGTLQGQTKAYGTDRFSVKSLGTPRALTRSLVVDTNVIDNIDSGMVTLAAAQDNQQALASSKGSLFTLALSEILDTQRDTATPKSLITAASKMLDEKLDDEILFKPNLTGDESMFEKVIVLTDAEARGEVNQSELLALVGDLDSIPVSVGEAKYFQGESINISLEVPNSGYLNILAVDSDDQMVVLFPNGLDQNNRVTAGSQSLPGARSFEWQAQPPWGSTMITVLFSQAPYNLFDTSLQRNENGTPIADYILPSIIELQGFSTEVGNGSAGVAFVRTCESSSLCD